MRTYNNRGTEVPIIEKRVDLEYPGCEGNPTHLVIDLTDVRSADCVRVSYDFDRDGWVIEQASTFEWEEVAFIKAWGREKAGE